jgi:dipeptidyl aminopeptidase/acylaminoacyl peptidase
MRRFRGELIMPGIRLAAAVALAAAFVATSAGAAAPLAAYGNLPSIEQVAISPSGQLLAFDVVKGESRKIVVESLVTRQIVGGVNVGEVKIRHLDWAGDQHLIITSSSTSGILGVLVDTSEWFVAADYNLATKRVQSLLGDIDYAGNFISGYPIVRSVGGKPTLFLTGIRFVGDDTDATLFRIDLDTDRSSPVMDTPGSQATHYLVGADGRPLAITSYDALSKHWELRVRSSNGWRTVQTRSEAIETPALLGLGRDGQSILVGDIESNRFVMRELSPDGASFSDPLPGPPSADTIHDPASHRLIGLVALEGDAWRYDFFDPSQQAQWRAIEAAFAGQRVQLVSTSDDLKKLVLRINSPADGPGYALVDLTAGATAWLGSEYGALTSADISPVTPVRFKAADGLEITGYLTLPRGRDPRQLPLVVFPHGGPAARDEPGFDWWAQAMASRGYAVLQVNYRGSDGFGWDFMAAGFGQWGRRMQTDLSDGVRYLASQGTVDPARVCIVGASYGGYAALAGPTLDAGVYRCAVDVSGPSDLARFIDWAKTREGDRMGAGTERYWTRFMGAGGLTDPHLADISPALQAAKVTVPILIIHGKDDTVVPFEQSQIMVDALHKAGKDVQLVVLNHEDHWLSRSDTRLQMLQATMDFLLKNNPPG